MADSISHRVTKVCTCVNQKRPVKYKQASKQTITSASPMELTGLGFLNLGPCGGGVDYLLVTTNPFHVSVKFIQHLLKVEKLLLIDCKMTSCSGLECLNEFCMTKKVNFRMPCLNNYLNCVASKSSGQCPQTNG